MTGWGRFRGALTAVGLAAALSGCGQLFTQSRQPATLTQLSSRVDALDAQVGEMQATLAGGGSGSGTGSGSATQSASGELQPGLQSAVVIADVLNVRTDPSLQGTVKGTLLQNARVNILSVDGNWTEITFTNASTQKTLTGWVDSDYLGPNPDTGSGAASTASTSGASSASAASGQSASAAGQSASATGQSASAIGAQASGASGTQSQPAAAQANSTTADSAALGGAY